MTREELIEFAMWLDEGTDYFGRSYIEVKADEWLEIKGKNIVAKPVLCGDSEQFYCWDEEALGVGSRCKVECDICKNKGQQ